MADKRSTRKSVRMIVYSQADDPRKLLNLDGNYCTIGMGFGTEKEATDKTFRITIERLSDTKGRGKK